jgi:signal transduction histidine kinase
MPHNPTRVKTPDSTVTPQAEELPLPGKQFNRFLLVFHVVFLGALIITLLNRWHQPAWALSWGEIWLLALVAAQIGAYLRFFAFPSRWTNSRSAWHLYFCAIFTLWFLSWRVERSLEWAIMAYMGQMFGVLPPRFSIPSTLLVLAVYLPTRIGWERLPGVSVKEWLAYGGFVFGWSALGLFLHRLVVTSAERAKLIQQLKAAQVELEAARQRDAEFSALRERERLARDLHDSLGHGLVTLNVQLEVAQRLYSVDPARASALMEEMKTLIRTSMEQLRRSLAGLRTPGLGDSPLTAAIETLCVETAKRSGLKITRGLPPELDRLPPAVSECLWRFAQETLCNVERHARASQVTLIFEYRPNEVVLRVSDDGCGIAPGSEGKSGHYGLRGLRERVEGLGGSFRVSANETKGATLEARIPLINL